MNNENKIANTSESIKTGILQRTIGLFLTGDLAPFLIVISLIAGAAAIFLTPREEEPQIVVPIADVHIIAPGLPVEDVERQVATRLEKLLAQIDGVEYVYSVSSPGQAIVTVRFFVGEKREESLVKIYNKIYSNIDQVHPDVTSWVVKPIEIDDVPIVNVSLWSDQSDEIDDFSLRRIAEELEIELQALPDTNRTQVIGGRPRVIRIELDANALSARQTSALEVAWALGVSNVRRPTGNFDQLDYNLTVEAGDFFENAQALRRAVVNVVDGVPVFLDDVAEVIDGPAERTAYTWIGFGPAESNPNLSSSQILFPAVHVTVAKKKGSNAVWVAKRVEKRLEEFKSSHFPKGVHARITRNYGETANAKVNELLEALVVAIIIVVGLIAYSLGWREGLVIAAAVPITFSLTLIINYWAGYTINRVTLFALILSLGLVVDDPIVDVENIYRHLRMRRESALDAVKTAMAEVMPPIVLATLAVIVAFLPLMLITGMMGPYMRPMALNVPVAMIMSMVVAFTITPWLTYRALRNHFEKSDEKPEAPIETSLLYRIYEKTLAPLLDSSSRAWLLLGGVILLFMFAFALVLFRAVPLKLLPFDNKNELQIIVNPIEGTTLERTDAIVRKLTNVLIKVPEVKDFQTYTGLASPMDFNGLVRHYFLRQGSHVADIRVNLADKFKRKMQSHEIALRLRNDLEAVVENANVRIAIVEVPPGPPVLATITAEVYGDPGVDYEVMQTAARSLSNRLSLEPGVADVDTSVEDDAKKLIFITDQAKAALSGVAAEDIAKTVGLALSGQDISRLHVPNEVNPLPIRLRLNRASRSGLEHLHALTVKGRAGIAKIRQDGGVKDAPIPVVRLGELGQFDQQLVAKSIYHKNLRRVVFVYAEAVGRAPAEVVIDVNTDLQSDTNSITINHKQNPRPLAKRSYLFNGGGMSWSLPDGVNIEWFGEGELNITKDVFRDLGIAFAVALIGIYLLLVYQTRSYAMPLILMISIPLTVIGIMPGFWLLNIFAGNTISGYQSPIFFTATAMIGMIALAGIAVRNAILLIEFLHVGLKQGLSLRAAILQAGAIRTRPILLTAGTAMLAAIPITLDPVFSGLAWALIFGLFVSTAFTLLVVPVTYNLVYRNRQNHGLPI
jgi:multidrug efflux pump subunit AcrB